MPNSKRGQDLCVTSQAFKCFQNVPKQTLISLPKEDSFNSKSPQTIIMRNGLQTTQNKFGLRLTKAPLVPFKPTIKNRAQNL